MLCCLQATWTSHLHVDYFDIMFDYSIIFLHVAVLTTGYGSSQSAITSLICQASYNHLNDVLNGYSVCSTCYNIDCYQLAHELFGAHLTYFES